jgi:ComEC/Rec2-related protein
MRSSAGCNMRRSFTNDNSTRYIDRPFNIRPLCFWAFFVGLTVTVCIAARGSVLWIALYFVVLFGAFIVLQFVKSRDKVIEFFGVSRLNFIVTVSLCLLVALSFALTTLSYSTQKSFAGYNDLTGVVERYNLNSDGSGWFVLSNAKFGTYALSGGVWVYIGGANSTALESVKSTHRIKVNTQLRCAPAEDFYINSRIKYTANIKVEPVTHVTPDNSLRSIILRYSQSFLRSHMDESNADLMFAMLFGDRSTLDGDLSANFSLTGIAHILTVSGLHVGIMVGLLMALLKLCRVGRKAQIPIITAVLLFYCYLCAFRYPILRASIMFLVFAIRRLFLKSNDMLSSISLAAIIILVLFPYSLFSLSFQSSFACVICIALFMLPVSKFFNRHLKVKWLSDGLAMYCVATMAFTPFMIKYFGFVSLVGVITNVIFLPLIILGFQVCALALVTWIAFPLLYLVNLGLRTIVFVTQWLASLPFSHIALSGGGYWFLLYFLGLILTTRFIFLRPRYKYSAAAVLILTYALLVIL